MHLNDIFIIVLVTSFCLILILELIKLIVKLQLSKRSLLYGIGGTIEVFTVGFLLYYFVNNLDSYYSGVYMAMIIKATYSITYLIYKPSMNIYSKNINKTNIYSRAILILIQTLILIIPIILFLIGIEFVIKDGLPFNVLSVSIIGVVLSALLTTTYNLYSREEDKIVEERKEKTKRENKIKNVKSFMSYNVNKVKHISTEMQKLDMNQEANKINESLEYILESISEIYKHQEYTTGETKIYKAEMLARNMKKIFSINLVDLSYTKQQYKHDIYELNRLLRYAETYIINE